MKTPMIHRWAGFRSGKRVLVRPCRTIERPESRISPAVIVATWIGGDGNWSDPSKWNIGLVPNNFLPATSQLLSTPDFIHFSDQDL